jgi:hypothetical protein
MITTSSPALGPKQEALLPSSCSLAWQPENRLPTVDDCQLLALPRIPDHRGNLTFVEGDRHIPFALKRVYYLYDVPGGAERAGHGHYQLQQLVIAMSGSFNIHLNDGVTERSFHLNRSYQGLYIPPMLWRTVDNFSSGSVCLVLASLPYDEADYFRTYESFLQARQCPWQFSP